MCVCAHKRVCWVRGYKERMWTQTHDRAEGRRPCDHRDGDGRDAAASYRTAGVRGRRAHELPGEGPATGRNGTDILILGFWLLEWERE